MHKRGFVVLGIILLGVGILGYYLKDDFIGLIQIVSASKDIYDPHLVKISERISICAGSCGILSIIFGFMFR